MAGRVIVVGSVNVDLVVSGDRLPMPGETVTGGAFARFHGGKGANQAVAAARLGAPTTFVGAVGADAFGAEARAALAADGVDLAGLATLPDLATGVALIVVDRAGENQIAVASGANGGLKPGHVSSALRELELDRADVVLVGHEIPTAATREALRLARAAGSPTILNPAPAVGIDRSTFGLADIVTPNRGELATLVAAEVRRTGHVRGVPDQPAVAARTLLLPAAEGAGVAIAVLVTLGGDGAVLVPRDGPDRAIPAPPVVAVDTVGAGDALNGALAAALAAGHDLPAAARRAVAAAGLAVTRAGARPGMPTLVELEAALDPADRRGPRAG